MRARIAPPKKGEGDMKSILGAVVLAILATTLGAGSADAACWWNGHRRVCNWAAPGPYYRNGWYGPRPFAPYPGWQRHEWCYYHPYRCR